jgi:hypothetical protein
MFGFGKSRALLIDEDPFRTVPGQKGLEVVTFTLAHCGQCQCAQ